MLKKQMRLAVMQPHLSNASREMFLELSQYCPLDLVLSPEPAGQGFQVADLPQGTRIRCFFGRTLRPLGPRVGWIQLSALTYMLRYRPQAVLLNANPRYLTFWLALVWARALGIPAFAHGHGFYRRGRIGRPYKLMMKALLRLVTTYVCYAPIVRQAFIDNGFSAQKLAVAHNSLINRATVTPEEKGEQEKKEKNRTELGILFIGRLRRESRLGLLIGAVERIRQEDGVPLVLHVVGEGEEEAALRVGASALPWVIFHGGVYDAKAIREISLQCFAGCYPGTAGLSVLHMMSLSLPVVTHNNLRAHGPEPSFIRDGDSGLLYDWAEAEPSLYRALRSLACDPAMVARMRANAFADYQALAHPSLAERFWSIFSRNEMLAGFAPASEIAACPSRPPGLESDADAVSRNRSGAERSDAVETDAERSLSSHG
jgi:glycosyltransferase involved in cell wall biosynthesis